MSVELRRVGKYELQKRLVRSNASEFWRAFDPQEQHYVTIKFSYTNQQVDSGFMTRFVQEAEKVAALHHPNIAQLYDVYFFPSKQLDNLATSIICMVMDYVEGQTLADYIRSTPSAGKLPPGAEIVHLFTSISLAIDYVHQHNIIHGNIKPTNILLDKSVPSQGRIGEPVLTDFSFSNLLRNNGGNIAPFYFSPEQIKGQPLNARSDIYSLGVILYELRTGVLPYRGNRPVAIMMQHINASPTPPALMNPTISPALANVILRSLAKDPAARFPSASSMVVALAKSLNMPVPESLDQSAYMPDGMLESFYTSSTPQLSQNNWSRSSIASAGGITSNVSPGSPAKERVLSAPSQEAGLPAFPSSTSRMRRRLGLFSMWYYIVIVALALAILGTFGTLFLFPRNNTMVATNRVVGHAFFVNSGQLNENNAQGLNDELQIDLANIPDPSPGKSYYAWILSDKSQTESAPVLIGQVSVSNGNAHFLYKGDQQHTNLLSFFSRFLVTEDTTGSPSSNPLIDSSTWRYYGEIPQTPSPLDKLHFSMLDHLRHLLVESPELKIRGLHGGLGLWFIRNIATISALASGARDDWHKNDTQSIRDQLIRILDYLDGNSLVHTDVPPGTPLLADRRTSQVALLGPTPVNPDPPGYGYNDDVPPGYVYLIGIHMAGAIQSPQTTPDQRKLAIQINTGLDSVKRLLEAVYRDAKQLVNLNDTQLLQPSSLSILDNLVTQAQDAYTGQFNLSNGQSEGGAIWIYGNLQRLASFDVKPYTASAV